MKTWRSANKDKVLKYKKTWAKNNRDKVNRAKRKRRDGRGLSEHEEILIKTTFNNSCFKCKDKNKLHFDHHIPLSKGGKLTLDNTVLLCKTCNGRKSNLDPCEFYSTDELKRLERILHGYA